MKSYIFPVVLEQDDDAWRAYIPALEAKGASTWGKTREEALHNMEEVAQLVLETLLEDGEPLPAAVQVSDEPVIAVSVG